MIDRRPLLDIITHLVLIIGVIAVCFPLWMTLVASTHAPEALSSGRIPLWFGDRAWENFSDLLAKGLPEAGGTPVGLMMINSLIMALGITIGKLAVSIIAAFAIVFFKFPFRPLFFWMIFITLMLPVEVRILPTFDVVTKLGMLNSYVGLCIPLIASATATFLFRQFYLTIPAELVEAARMDQAGPLRFLKDIVLPLSRTNIAALFIILFIYGWNQYLWPLLVTTDPTYTTVVMGIQRMVNAGESLPVWNYIMGTATLALLPPVLVVIFMQKIFVKGLVDSEK
ncbi:MAG TPA: sn-glycerol-3-phosphate ABC transporter permease UgpE [Alphaproteobacteria bacterium]|jgi:ABC-type sugar transport system, permease component|nr:sn-glycerol-3-phosphate ABC transporter permease UgpE [Alphaproteobacteria bacterium]HCJ62486.1 sn-glycerol-3-phosphate ABC transporter permease UgpE [Alphaproteobacteria bacterium]